MGWTLRTQAGSLWVGMVIAGLTGWLASGTSNAQILYDINFTQFPLNTLYSTASGPPNDFSSYYPSGADTSGVYCIIDSAFLRLTNQTLVCSGPGQGFGNFVMQMGNLSSNIVTLNIQLMLDNTVGASVGFGQAGAPGSNLTSVILSFPESSTSTVNVQSVDGPTNSLAVLYSFATSLIRSNIQNISFSLNLAASTFSLKLNGASLASNAVIGASQPLNQAAITIGNANGNGSLGGIGNVVLAASPAADISSIFMSGTNVFLVLPTASTARYDIQTTTDLVMGAWSTIYSNIPGTGGITNLNCGSSAVPQRFFRADAHP